MLCCVSDPGSDLGLHVDGMSCPQPPLLRVHISRVYFFPNSKKSQLPAHWAHHEPERMGPNMHIHTHTKRPLF